MTITGKVYDQESAAVISHCAHVNAPAWFDRGEMAGGVPQRRRLRVRGQRHAHRPAHLTSGPARKSKLEHKERVCQDPLSPHAFSSRAHAEGFGARENMSCRRLRGPEKSCPHPDGHARRVRKPGADVAFGDGDVASFLLAWLAPNRLMDKGPCTSTLTPMAAAGTAS